MYDDGSKHKVSTGVPQGSVLGPSICNFVLGTITKDFFVDTQFPKNPVVTNMRGKKREQGLQVPKGEKRFLIGYAGDLMIKVISREEANYAIEKMKGLLARAGLQLNHDKTRVYKLMEKSRFE